MTAEVLREAAALMRERAQVATPGPWLADVLGSKGYAVREVNGKPRPGSRIPRPVRVARCGYEDWDTDKANAEHIAGMHPFVTLAVADWLDGVAHDIEAREGDDYFDLDGDPIAPEDTHAIGSALAVARAYLNIPIKETP